MERTLIILKPDAVRRNLIGTVLNIFTQHGLEIEEMIMLQPTKEHIAAHYSQHVSKAFYSRIEQFMTSNKIVICILRGYGAIRCARKLVGATNPMDAEPGTIRQMYASSYQENVVHASETFKDVVREIKIWFR